MEQVPTSCDVYGVREMFTADWHAGLGRSASWLPSMPATQQPAEAANAKLKRDLRRGRKLCRHQDVLSALQDATKTWCQPLLPVDAKRGKPITLMGPDGKVVASRPCEPCPWMLQEGRKIRPPFCKKVMHYPPISKVLHLMHKSKGTSRQCFEESKRDDYQYLCLKQARQQPVAAGTLARMLSQLKATNCETLKALWLQNGILKEEDGMSHPKFMQEIYEETWAEYCLIWQRLGDNQEAEPTRCTCWHYCWRNTCHHVFVFQEFFGLRIWTGPIIPRVPSSKKRPKAKPKGSSEDSDLGRKKRKPRRVQG